MHRKPPPSPTLAETAHAGLRPASSARGTLAGLTALAVGVTLILGSALPVSADRPASVCQKTLSEVSTPCTAHP